MDGVTAVSAAVAADPSGRSRGYGTLRYATKEDAAKAMDAIAGRETEGRVVTVKVDRFA